MTERCFSNAILRKTCDLWATSPAQTVCIKESKLSEVTQLVGSYLSSSFFFLRYKACNQIFACEYFKMNVVFFCCFFFNHANTGTGRCFRDKISFYIMPFAAALLDDRLRREVMESELLNTVFPSAAFKLQSVFMFQMLYNWEKSKTPHGTAYGSKLFIFKGFFF